MDYEINELILNNKLKKLKELINTKKLSIHKSMFSKNRKFFHYVFKYGSKELMDFVIKFNILNYGDVNKNILDVYDKAYNMNCYHILATRPKLLIHYMKLYPPEDVNAIAKDKYNILSCYIIRNNINIEDLKFFKKLGCNLLPVNNFNPLYMIILKKINDLDEIQKIFKLKIHKIPFKLIKDGYSSIFKIVLNKYKFDYNLLYRSDNILSYAIYNKNTYVINYLIEKKEKYIDRNFLDENNNSYFHLYLLVNPGYELNIMKKLVSYLQDINQQNFKGDTVIHLILKFKRWDIFEQLFINKTFDDKIKNKDGLTIYDYIDNDIIREKVKKCLIMSSIYEENDIKLIKTKTIHFTNFSSQFDVLLSSIYYMLKKYKNIAYPIFEYVTIKKIEFFDAYTRYNDKNPIGIFHINASTLGIEIKYNKKIFNFIRHNIKKDFIFIIVSVIHSKGLHANILIIDNIYKTIELFEPHGSSGRYYNDIDIHKKFKSFFLKEFSKEVSLKYEYYSPIDYQNINDFQNIESHSLYVYKNFNEVFGFCLAWVFWYLEHRIINKNVKNYILIKKLRNKIIKDKFEIHDIIRSYGQKLKNYNSDSYKRHDLNTYHGDIQEENILNLIDDIKKIQT